MFENKKKVVLAFCLISIAYILGYRKGKKKGDGMIELANELCEQNAQQVEELNKQTIRVNRAISRIKDWEAENDEDFWDFED